MTHLDHKRNVSARRWTAVAVVAAVALIVLSSAIAARPANAASLPLPAPPTPSSIEQFGANTGVLFNSGGYTPAQIDSQLAALARTGATVVRSDALWEDTEPQPPIGLLHRYNWSFDDLIVRSLATHGLRWLPIIDYSAPWAQSLSGQDHSPPSSVSDYSAYAGAVAARYGPEGSFWIENPQLTPMPVETYEIWNEPDNPVFWRPTPDPSAYAVLYGSARAAITAAQPGSQVIIGGLMHPSSFLSAMLAADPGLRGQIDGVGIHPYASTPTDVLAGVRNARLAMRSDGLADVPLYVTEFGWTTHKSGAHDWAPEQLRPGYISRTLSMLGHTDCGIAGVLLYAWVTPERDPANAQDWFGVSPPGAGASPDSAAFTAGLLAAGASGPTIPLCSGAAALGTSQISSSKLRARPATRSLRSRAARSARHRKRTSVSTCRRSGARSRRCRAR